MRCAISSRLLTSEAKNGNLTQPTDLLVYYTRDNNKSSLSLLHGRDSGSLSSTYTDNGYNLHIPSAKILAHALLQDVGYNQARSNAKKMVTCFTIELRILYTDPTLRFSVPIRIS